MDTTLTASEFTLRNLGQINVILGKNGCGKSFLLKAFAQILRANPENGTIRYVSPERGGSIEFLAHVGQQIATNSNWLHDERNKNQSETFRQQSTALFQRLELRVLRNLEKYGETNAPKFAKVIAGLQTLLDRVELQRDDSGFTIIERDNGLKVHASQLSSGESELISLGIEFLSFAHEAVPDKSNFLLVDEPDVHLHPDLQHRLAEFILQVIAIHPVTFIIATHSTPLLAALAGHHDARVAFMKRGDKELTFR